MATKLLNGIVQEDLIRPALSNDIQSKFCWVMLYVNYQRALTIADDSARHEIFRDLSQLFAANNVRNLLQQRHSAQWTVSLDDTDRYYRATRSLTDYIEAHVHEDLAGFLDSRHESHTGSRYGLLPFLVLLRSWHVVLTKSLSRLVAEFIELPQSIFVLSGWCGTRQVSMCTPLSRHRL